MEQQQKEKQQQELFRLQQAAFIEKQREEHEKQQQLLRLQQEAMMQKEEESLQSGPPGMPVGRGMVGAPIPPSGGTVPVPGTPGVKSSMVVPLGATNFAAPMGQGFNPPGPGIIGGSKPPVRPPIGQQQGEMRPPLINAGPPQPPGPRPQITPPRPPLGNAPNPPGGAPPARPPIVNPPHPPSGLGSSLPSGKHAVQGNNQPRPPGPPAPRQV